VHNCRARIVTAGRGRFEARITQARLDDLSLFLSAESLPRRATVSLAPDRLFFRFSRHGDPARRADADTDPRGTISASVGRPGAEDVTIGPSVSRSMCVPLGLALARLDPLFDGGAETLLGSAGGLRPEALRLERFARLHEELLRDAVACHGAGRASPRLDAMSACLWNMLAESLADTLPGKPAGRIGRRRVTMHRLADFIEANSDRPLMLHELCAVAGCSAKSLETLFLRVVGETPNRYLRRWRLWRAHLALAAADPETTTVAQVAVSFGFWELGRFSGAYRSMFGETPSQTLRAPDLRQMCRHIPPITRTA
jgi:AraC-like DNA-binding protein